MTEPHTRKFQWMGQPYAVVKTPCHDCPSCGHIERLEILGPENGLTATGSIAGLLWHLMDTAAPIRR